MIRFALLSLLSLTANVYAAESTVDFIRNGIILQTMGEEGLYWTPFLLTMFSFGLLQCDGICLPPLDGSASAPTDCNSISSA